VRLRRVRPAPGAEAPAATAPPSPPASVASTSASTARSYASLVSTGLKQVALDHAVLAAAAAAAAAEAPAGGEGPARAAAPPHGGGPGTAAAALPGGAALAAAMFLSAPGERGLVWVPGVGGADPGSGAAACQAADAAALMVKSALSGASGGSSVAPPPPPTPTVETPPAGGVGTGGDAAVERRHGSGGGGGTLLRPGSSTSASSTGDASAGAAAAAATAPAAAADAVSGGDSTSRSSQQPLSPFAHYAGIPLPETEDGAAPVPDTGPSAAVAVDTAASAGPLPLPLPLPALRVRVLARGSSSGSGCPAPTAAPAPAPASAPAQPRPPAQLQPPKSTCTSPGSARSDSGFFRERGDSIELPGVFGMVRISIDDWVTREVSSSSWAEVAGASSGPSRGPSGALRRARGGREEDDDDEEEEDEDYTAWRGRCSEEEVEEEVGTAEEWRGGGGGGGGRGERAFVVQGCRPRLSSELEALLPPPQMTARGISEWLQSGVAAAEHLADARAALAAAAAAATSPPAAPPAASPLAGKPQPPGVAAAAPGGWAAGGGDTGPAARAPDAGASRERDQSRAGPATAPMVFPEPPLPFSALPPGLGLGLGSNVLSHQAAVPAAAAAAAREAAVAFDALRAPGLPPLRRARSRGRLEAAAAGTPGALGTPGTSGTPGAAAAGGALGSPAPAAPADPLSSPHLRLNIPRVPSLGSSFERHSCQCTPARGFCAAPGSARAASRVPASPAAAASPRVFGFDCAAAGTPRGVAAFSPPARAGLSPASGAETPAFGGASCGSTPRRQPPSPGLLQQVLRSGPPGGSGGSTPVAAAAGAGVPAATTQRQQQQQQQPASPWQPSNGHAPAAPQVPLNREPSLSVRLPRPRSACSLGDAAVSGAAAAGSAGAGALSRPGSRLSAVAWAADMPERASPSKLEGAQGAALPHGASPFAAGNQATSGPPPETYQAPEAAPAPVATTLDKQGYQPANGRGAGSVAADGSAGGGSSGSRSDVSSEGEPHGSDGAWSRPGIVTAAAVPLARARSRSFDGCLSARRWPPSPCGPPPPSATAAGPHADAATPPTGTVRLRAASFDGSGGSGGGGGGGGGVRPQDSDNCPGMPLGRHASFGGGGGGGGAPQREPGTPLVLSRIEGELQEVLTASGRRTTPYVPVRGMTR
jgi:hypothetical protein